MPRISLICSNTTLCRLLVADNEISDEEVRNLANVLTHQNTTLIALIISENKLVSDSSIDALIEMLRQNQTLQWFDIKECNLSEKGKERLRKIAESKRDFRLEI